MWVEINIGSEWRKETDRPLTDTNTSVNEVLSSAIAAFQWS